MKLEQCDETCDENGDDSMQMFCGSACFVEKTHCWGNAPQS